MARRTLYNLPFDVFECDSCAIHSPLEVPTGQLDDWLVVRAAGERDAPLPGLPRRRHAASLQQASRGRRRSLGAAALRAALSRRRTA